MAPLADFLARTVPISLPDHLRSYVVGKTPLSTPQEVFPALVAYLVIVFSLRAYMKNRPPLKLQRLFQLHNIILSAGSGLLLACMIEEIAPLYYKNGTFWAMCNEGMWTDRLEFYYLINYYFKYLELIDTVFLALKKKPLAFLHVYHHSATALLCYTQLNGKTSVQWIPISINLSVHVLMYYYYYATAGGAKIWWKKHLTTMQIAQFIIDLFAVYFGTYSYYAANYFSPLLPTMGSCAGTESAAVFGCAILSSYLVLFIQFYINTYKKPAKGKAPVANGKAVANGKPVANGNGIANGHGCVPNAGPCNTFLMSRFRHKLE
ncbi:GNS1/SUR4 membrane protein [Laetiporus sulphureus 93-53]|uniref:Elongation of fatty acids protein n=1 Tax=Laetiporus sulphureus 93-53 TaxID=1314785 RepID=A0A165CFB8_9APHY|nr:GNS1/SUR4 membrane protein [Laetiporus sulphureus 93-53]KZT02707.1 GNS1/SUR4 membrane protein [Laetiporus sulphureus 93-53]